MLTVDKQVKNVLSTIVVMGVLVITVPLEAMEYCGICSLIPEEPEVVDYFGYSVSIHDNLVLVSSTEEAVFLFDVESGNQIFKFTPPNAPDGLYGSAIAINDSYVAISAGCASNNGSQSGSVYIYDIVTKEEIRIIIPDDIATGDCFGSAISLFDQYIAISSPCDDYNGASSGSAYIYNLETGLLLYHLIGDNTSAGDHFGTSISMNADYCIVGASQNDQNGENSGSAYIFDLDTGEQLHRLSASDAEQNDEFGCSVACSTELAIIGKEGEDTNEIAYLFDIQTGEQIRTLTSIDDHDYHQISVSVFNEKALVGTSYFLGGETYLFDILTGEPIKEFVSTYDTSVAINSLYFVIGDPFERTVSVWAGLGDQDCNSNTRADYCDLHYQTSLDCNNNSIPDECDITSGTSIDCNSNQVPDECDLISGIFFDCNTNGLLDTCDIDLQLSWDCNENAIPDECEGITHTDCNLNGRPDSCDILVGDSYDCNNNSILDECDLLNGTSIDCDSNGIPDECESDCNSNGMNDRCDISQGVSPDCNHNNIPDECDLESQYSIDHNSNGIPDECPELWYVDDDAEIGGNGSTWETAFKYLQNAFWVAGDGDTIWVAAGIYTPDHIDLESKTPIPGNRYASFQLTGGVSLYGGFAGNEDPETFELGQRDLIVNPTILSGDLLGNDSAEGESNNDENAYHVVECTDSQQLVIFDGFTVMGGNANSFDSDADDGGGFWINNGNIEIKHCLIQGNYAKNYGGGVFAQNSYVQLVDSRIIENHVNYNGGGVYLSDITPCDYIITNCVISNNEANSGAGIYANRRTKIINSLIDSNVGQGIYDNGGLTVINATIVNNSSFGIYLYYSYSTIYNSIIRGNRSFQSAQFSGGPGQVYYCNVENGWAGENNIDVDAQFVNPEQGDYRLLPGSPCIDIGSNEYLPMDEYDLDQDGDTSELLPLDLARQIRRYDDPNTFDFGVGDPPIVDIGAYEFQPYPFDPDSNGVVDLSDFAEFQCCFGKVNHYCLNVFDLNNDQEVNLDDFLQFQESLSGPQAQ